MGRPVETTSSSLERLKKLQDIPSLENALEEAYQLCNHSARAELILKWLHIKMQEDESLGCALPKAWLLYEQCLDLLGSNKIAGLLDSETLQRILQIRDPSDLNGASCFLERASVLAKLLDRTTQPEGARIKALLRYDSITASDLIGSLLSVYQYHHAKHNVQDSTTPNVILTCLKIWALRKNGPQDDMDFANKMLPPICYVLAGLKQNADALTTNRKRKRDRDPHDDDIISCTRDLEGLVARHIFMPARTVYFSHGGEGWKEGDKIVAPSDDLVARLSRLRQPEGNQQVVRLSWLSVLPILMDIALRCVSLPTPRQKLKEQPWVESLFSACIDCLGQPDVAKTNRKEALIAILEAVRRHASISTKYLRLQIDTSTAIDTSDCEDWVGNLKLCAKVIELDPDVFTLGEEGGHGDKLFETLSEHGQVTYGQEASKDSQVKERRILLKDKIAIPLLQAAARTRSLHLFIEKWHAKLATISDVRLADWSVWAELDDALADVLESSLLQSQVTEIVNTCYEDMKAFHTEIALSGKHARTKPASAYREKLQRFNARVIVLKALLAGVRSDELKDSVFEELELVFKEIARVCLVFESSTLTKTKVFDFDRRIWPLATRLFELWFPRWALRQRESSAVEEEALIALSGGIGEAAAATITLGERASERRKRDHEALLSKHGDIETRSLATHFIATLCSKTFHYQRCQDRVRELCAAIAKHSDDLATRSLIAYPQLRDWYSGHSEGSSTITDLSSFSPQDIDSMIVEPAKARLFTISLANKQRTTDVMDLLKQSVEILQSIRGRGMEQQQSMALRVISSAPLSILDRPAREGLLDICTNVLDYSDLRGAKYQSLLSQRFALILSLLRLPHGTAKISTDASVLWKIASSVMASGSGSSASGANDGEDSTLTATTVLKMFGEVVRLVLKPLAGDAGQERNSKILEDHLEQLLSLAERTGQDKKSRLKIGELTCAEALLASCNVDLENQQHSALARQLLPSLKKRAEQILTYLQAKKGYKPQHAVELERILRIWNRIARGTKGDKEHITTVQGQLTGFVASLFAIYGQQYEGADESEFPASCFPCLFEAANKFADGDGSDKLLKTLNPALLRQVLVADLDERERASVSRGSGLYAVHNSEAVLRLGLQEAITGLNEGDMSMGALRLLQCCIGMVHLLHEEKELPAVKPLLPALLTFLTTCKDYQQYRLALESTSELLRAHNKLTNQYTIELSLVACHSLVTKSPAPTADTLIFLDVCQLTTTLLLQYRSRLQGRYHLLLALFQTLLSRLFNPQKSHIFDRKPLGPKHAHAFTRLLTLFCNPPTPHNRGNKQSKTKSLVDESRIQRARVGEFVPALLHSYCSLVLSGTLTPGVREALLPGLWAVIECMGIFEGEAVKVLSSAVNASERAVLRGIIEEWKMLGKWKGG